MKKRFLSMFALLLMAATGAMAADGIECSASDKGKVICTDGSIYAKVSDVPTGKTAVAMIAYIDMENKKGLALALSDEGSMTWGAAKTTCEGKSAVDGGTWVLPSKEQWEAMGAVDSNADAATALRDGFSSVGGTNMQSVAYWSSTANSTDANKAYRYYFTNGFYWENNVNKTVNNYVRACLTFNILVAPPTYSVTLADGTEDAGNWTISPAKAEEGATVTATYSGDRKVKSVKAVKKATAYAANEYNEGSWDSTNKKVVFTKQAAASVTAVANSDAAVTWDAGWYTVSGTVTITGDVTLIAETHLILCDGAKLTINGQLIVGNNNLYIYGQKKGDGKLNVTNNSDTAIRSNMDYRIDIHGGEVTASAAGDLNDGLYTGYLKVYGGKLTVTSGGTGINFENTFDVYDGEVVATSNATSSTRVFYGIMSGGGSNSQILKVYGGKVTATGNGITEGDDYGSGIRCYVWSGTSGIKFYFSADGTTWGEGLGYNIAALVGTYGDTKKRYAKAE